MQLNLSSTMAKSASRMGSILRLLFICIDSANSSFNPGRIDPNNAIWDSARKPLVAVWETTNGNRFMTINVHNTAKSDAPGSSTQGDDRPPVNPDVTKRMGQVQTIAVSLPTELHRVAETKGVCT